jgi:hypothetical protein
MLSKTLQVHLTITGVFLNLASKLALTEVHGFADASEKAYGGGIFYIRTIQPDGEISVNILCAKSRVC